MYCNHCGYKLNESKVESKKSSFEIAQEVEIDENTKVQYVCPRCGRVIHEDLSHDEYRELSQASHAQVQRGNNSFAGGMCLNSLGVIFAIISLIFFLLSNKPLAGFVTNCGEFYVAVALLVVATFLLVFGIWKTVTGLKTKLHYSKLLKDINNNTFVQ